MKNLQRKLVGVLVSASLALTVLACDKRSPSDPGGSATVSASPYINYVFSGQTVETTILVSGDKTTSCSPQHGGTINPQGMIPSGTKVVYRAPNTGITMSEELKCEGEGSGTLSFAIKPEPTHVANTPVTYIHLPDGITVAHYFVSMSQEPGTTLAIGHSGSFFWIFEGPNTEYDIGAREVVMSGDQQAFQPPLPSDPCQIGASGVVFGVKTGRTISFTSEWHPDIDYVRIYFWYKKKSEPSFPTCPATFVDVPIGWKKAS